MRSARIAGGFIPTMAHLKTLPVTEDTLAEHDPRTALHVRGRDRDFDDVRVAHCHTDLNASAPGTHFLVYAHLQ